MKLSGLIVAACCASLAPAAMAWDPNREEVRAFTEQMVSKHSFDEAFVTEMLSGSESQSSIIKAMKRPAEKAKPWHEYRDIFVTDERIDAGVAFWNENRERIDRIAAETGVPGEILVGIVGVETYFGRITGSYRVVDALSTLAFDYPPRSTFFTRELEEYFLLTREENLPLTELKGSYAGAMGSPQFIPSSYRAYAVDGDGDGVRDLFNSWDDVLASVANYFSEHRWKSNQEVVASATLRSPDAESLVDNGLKLNSTVADLSAADVLFATDLDGSDPARLMKLEGEEGPEYYVAFHNLYVITRYNRSNMYALAVHQLGQEIGARMNTATLSRND